METLTKQVSRARRRLTLQQFLTLLCWCWFAALVVASGVIVADWYWSLKPLAALGATGSGGWVSAAGAEQVEPLVYVGLGLVAGLLAAAVWTAVRRTPPMVAAIEIDRRFGLKERVSSALSLGPQDIDSEAGAAVLADAERRVRNLHVPEKFSVRLNRWSWLPILPALLAAGLVLFLPDINTHKADANNVDKVAARKAVQKKAEQIKKSFQDRREEAEKKGLKELEDLFKEFERGLKNEFDRTTETDKKEAVVKLNNLAEDLKKRRDQLEPSESLKEQLSQQLKGLNEGPADKLSEALKEGDLKKALDEINKLKNQLASDKLSPEDRQKLAEQLNQMKEKLDKAAQAYQQQKESLKRQIDQAKKAGDKQTAQKLQQQLDKLQQQEQQMQQMQQMSQQLGQCAQCMQEGKMGEAMAGLEAMKGELEELQQQLDELKMLDEALDELADAKDAMLNDQFGSQAQGQGDGERDQPGDGLGRGRGIGYRPESATDGNKFIDSNVKTKPNPKGSAVVVGEVDGPNIKGNVREEIKAAVQASRSEETDPLTGQRLPRGYTEHAKEYFNLLREGKK
jgi:hypothetical protein